MSIENHFDSLNGGNQMCLRAFSGVLIKNGFEKTILKIGIDLAESKCINIKNNLYYFHKGISLLDKKTMESAIFSAKNSYDKLVENFAHLSGEMEEIRFRENERKELAGRAKKELENFGKLCNSEYLKKVVPFGIINPLSKTKYIIWGELDFDFFNYRNDYKSIHEKILKLLENVDILYCNDMIPDDMDIQILYKSIDELNIKYMEICNLIDGIIHGSESAESNKSNWIKESSALIQELSKMPSSGQWGLFHLCNKKFKNEGHFPVIFELENIIPLEL